MINVLVPRMPLAEHLLPYLHRIDEARWYSNFGQLEIELRQKLEYKYQAHVVTVASCTAGLELMYRHLRRSGRKYISLPAMTFPATIMAAEREGLTVKWAEVDKDNWTADSVSGFGVPVDGFFVDAAAAFGEQVVKRHQMAVFSMHATKAFGCGEGGYIVTHDQKLAEQLRRETNFGFPHNGRTSQQWGTNAKLSEYAAAVALASLAIWEYEPWVRLHHWYERHLPLIFVKQKRPPGAYPILSVKLPTNRVEEVRAIMTAKGIETRRWYYPLMHHHPMVSVRGEPIELPITEHLSERLLGLPYHLFLTEQDVIEVCTALTMAVNQVEGA